MSIFKKENGTLVEYTNPIANNCIAPVEDGGTSAHAYAEGAFVMVRNILKKLTSAVVIGDTIDNTNSQDTTVATELAEIEGDIEQINSDFSNIKTYSTDEKEVGTWVDGRTIYEKTFIYNEGLSQGAHTKLHGISNFDRMIYAVGSMKNTSSNGGDYALPFASSSQQVNIYTTSTDIRVSVLGDLSGYTKTYVTLRYIKTT